MTFGEIHEKYCKNCTSKNCLNCIWADLIDDLIED